MSDNQADLSPQPTTTSKLDEKEEEVQHPSEEKRSSLFQIFSSFSFFTFDFSGKPSHEADLSPILSSLTLLSLKSPPPISSPSPSPSPSLKSSYPSSPAFNVPENPICVDALNFAPSIFTSSNQDFWNLTKVTKNFKSFLRILKPYNPIFFIDDGIETSETMRKWQKRREKQIISMKRLVPQNANVMLGDLAKRRGIPVVYSLELDCDDTIAEYASLLACPILSSDQDFYSYPRKFQIFEIKKWRMVPCQNKNRRVTRKLSGQFPSVSSSPQVIFKRKEVEGGYYLLKGNPSPLTRLMGSPHARVEELRQALYARILKGEEGKTPTVLEEYPDWDPKTSSVVWIKKEVLPSTKFDHLLDDPTKAVNWFFGKDRQPQVKRSEWKKHLFCVHVICFHLCAIANGVSLLDMMSKHKWGSCSCCSCR